jgi:hypothetical protein
MATYKHTVEVDPDKLGVLQRHDFLMATDEDYRKEALTPPGGYAPGEKGKPEDQPSGDASAAVVATVASE